MTIKTSIITRVYWSRITWIIFSTMTKVISRDLFLQILFLRNTIPFPRPICFKKLIFTTCRIITTNILTSICFLVRKKTGLHKCRVKKGVSQWNTCWMTLKIRLSLSFVIKVAPGNTCFNSFAKRILTQ